MVRVDKFCAAHQLNSDANRLSFSVSPSVRDIVIKKFDPAGVTNQVSIMALFMKFSSGVAQRLGVRLPPLPPKDSKGGKGGKRGKGALDEESFSQQMFDLVGAVEIPPHGWTATKMDNAYRQRFSAAEEWNDPKGGPSGLPQLRDHLHTLRNTRAIRSSSSRLVWICLFFVVRVLFKDGNPIHRNV